MSPLTCGLAGNRTTAKKTLSRHQFNPGNDIYPKQTAGTKCTNFWNADQELTRLNLEYSTHCLSLLKSFLCLLPEKNRTCGKTTGLDKKHCVCLRTLADRNLTMRSFLTGAVPFSGSRCIETYSSTVTIAAPYPGIDPRAVHARFWDGHYATTRRDCLVIWQCEGHNSSVSGRSKSVLFRLVVDLDVTVLSLLRPVRGKIISWLQNCIFASTHRTSLVHINGLKISYWFFEFGCSVCFAVGMCSCLPLRRLRSAAAADWAHTQLRNSWGTPSFPCFS